MSVCQLGLRCLAAGLVFTTLSGRAGADTLASLERERAEFVAVLTTGQLTPAERQQQLEASAHRLRDLERMVLRDEDLLGRATPEVRRALAHYELTFLLHAAAEHGVGMPELWFEEVGLSTERLLRTRVGWR